MLCIVTRLVSHDLILNRIRKWLHPLHGPHRTVTTHTVYSDSDLCHSGFKPEEGGGKKWERILQWTLLKLCILSEKWLRFLLNHLKSITLDSIFIYNRLQATVNFLHVPIFGFKAMVDWSWDSSSDLLRHLMLPLNYVWVIGQPWPLTRFL